MKTPIEKQSFHPVLLTSYQVTKKIIKYGLYIFLLYFAFRGFMA